SIIGAAALGVDLAWRVLLASAQPNFAAIGVTLRADGVGVFLAPVLLCACSLAIFALAALRNDEVQVQVTPLAFSMLLCMTAGWTIALFGADLIAVFLGAQIAWLASIGLTAFSAEADRAGLSGALRMLTLGGGAAALMALGIAALARGAETLELG